MPWRTMDVQQQRVEFVTAAKRRSQPFRALCEEFGISRPTGYLWLHRYEQRGVQGIAERSRRPLASPRRTAADLEQRVVDVRQRYPDWGARKLREILAREGFDLARNTIHRILLRHGLVKECDQHPPALQRCWMTTAAMCWCWRPTATPKLSLCASNWRAHFRAAAFLKRC